METSPRSNAILAGVLGVIAAAVLSYAFLDRPIAEAVSTWPAGVVSVFEVVTDLGHSTKYIVAAATGAIVFGLVWRRARARAASLLILGAIVVPGLMVNCLKFVVGRPRPHRWVQRQEWAIDPFTFEYAYSSFPSGHSSTAFGLAMALGLLWPRLRPMWFTLAAIVAVSRVVVEAHYLSDVIVGGALGAGLAWWWSRQLLRWDRAGLKAWTDPDLARGDARA